MEQQVKTEQSLSSLDASMIVSAENRQEEAAIGAARAASSREERYDNPFIRFLNGSASNRSFYGQIRKLVYQWLTAHMSKPPAERGMTTDEYIRMRTQKYIRTLTTTDCERGIYDYGLQDALDLWRKQSSDAEYPCVVSMYHKLIHMAVEEEMAVIRARWEYRGTEGPM
jgi:hypothetical protein